MQFAFARSNLNGLVDNLQHILVSEEYELGKKRF